VTGLLIQKFTTHLLWISAFPKGEENQFLFFAPIHAEYKKFSAALSHSLSSITKRGRKKKKGYDAVIWSHRSAQKKEKHLKGAGNSRMFLFHQKTLFFSILFCAARVSGEIPTRTRSECGIYIYFSLSVLFTYSLLSYSTHKNALFAALWRASLALSACTKEAGEKWPSLRCALASLSMRERRWARTQN
jgi:hypothetical protein